MEHELFDHTSLDGMAMTDRSDSSEVVGGALKLVLNILRPLYDDICFVGFRKSYSADSLRLRSSTSHVTMGL